MMMSRPSILGSRLFKLNFTLGNTPTQCADTADSLQDVCIGKHLQTYSQSEGAIAAVTHSFKPRARTMPDGHGRDGRCQPPPVQIPACAANAPGSSLGFWRRSGD